MRTSWPSESWPRISIAANSVSRCFWRYRLTGRAPKFVKNFIQGQDSIQAALSAYVSEVKAVTFPGEEHGFSA